MAGKHSMSLSAQLKLDIQNFSKNLSKASTNMSNFAKKQKSNMNDFASELTKASVRMSTWSKETAKQYGDLDRKFKRLGISLRDISRIASGIVISQTFYTIARAIREATDALLEFNESLDYAKVTYTALMGSESTADSFLSSLQEQAINTMFSFEDLTQSSKKLLAYGIDYKNVGYITEGLTSLASISGDSQAMDRLAYAIGQIYAKGKLAAEEMRQLSNAYVPIQQILREKLGVSQEDMGNIGNLNIPAYAAINAIVEYANERFGDVSEAAMLTITGLKNKITDTLKVTGSEMMQPFTVALKSFLNWVSNQLNALREAYSKNGAGGIFEFLVPDEVQQQRLRQFFATVSNMFMAITRLIMSIWPLVKSLINGAIDAFNLIQPIITATYNLLAAGISIITKNSAALKLLTGVLIAAASAWVLFKIKAVGALIVTTITKAVYALSRAVMVLSVVLTKGSAAAIAFKLSLVAVAAILIGLAAGSDRVREKLSGIMDKFSELSGGLKSDDILQLEEGLEKTTDASEDFNYALSDSSNALSDLNDEAQKAKKGLLSFDEVFKLNDTKDETSGYDLSELDGILEGLNVGEIKLPEIPDFSKYTDEFANKLYGDLWNSMSRIATGTAAGALIGGLIGFAIGGLVTKTMAGAMTGAKWGSRIGAIVGGGFATFWDDAYEQMSRTVSLIAVSGGAGALIGGLVGMVVAAFATPDLKGKPRMDALMNGAKLGSAIGASLFMGFAGFWDIVKNGFENSMQGALAGGGAGSLIGGLIGLIIGAFSTKTVKGALTGASIGGTIGALLGTGIGGFWGKASDEMKQAIENILVGGAEGALLGGVVGMIIGAFATKDIKGALTGAKYGSMIGAAIGGTLEGVFGDAENTFSDKLSNMFSTIGAASKGMFIGGLAGMIIGAIVGAFAGGIGALPGARLGATVGAAAGGLIGALTAKLEEMDAGEVVSNWFNKIGEDLKNAAGAVKEWFIDDGNWKGMLRLIYDPIGGALELLYNNNEDFKNWVDDLKTKISDGFDNIKQKISDWYNDTKQNISDWATNTAADISIWYLDTKQKISDWYNDTKQNISDWATNTAADISVWYLDTKQKISDWYNDTKQNISDWATNTAADISIWYLDTKQKISNWYTETKQKISNWYDDTKQKIYNWSSETKQKISDWSSATKQNISDWTITTANKLGTWYTDTKNGMSNWVSETKTSLKNWWNNLWNPDNWKSGWSLVKDWFNSLFDDIQNWFSDLWDSISDWWESLWSGKSVSLSTSGSSKASIKTGHATGGIFNREHIARFAEGNKAEAVIPLENASAMQPFVDAISNGIVASLAPTLATVGAGSASSDMPPVYVGTLIGDERGLKELERKLKIIRVKEEKRGN